MSEAPPEPSESVEVAVRRMEDRLTRTRGFAARGMRELHRRMRKDLRAAERRATRAERRLANSKERTQHLRAEVRKARRRARRAEAQLAALRAERTGSPQLRKARGFAGRIARRLRRIGAS